MARMAGDEIIRRDTMFGNPGQYLNDTEMIPSTRGVSYPQDQRPAGSFGDGVDPTILPMMRDGHMRSLYGGISQLAPRMVDGYVDHPAVQDTGLPYILTPNIQQLQRESMNQFQDSPAALNMLFKGV